LPKYYSKMLKSSSTFSTVNIFVLSTALCFVGATWRMSTNSQLAKKKTSCCGGGSKKVEKKVQKKAASCCGSNNKHLQNFDQTTRPETVLVCLSPGNSFFNIENLKGMAAYAKKNYETIYLFTGEAISWHNYKALGRRIGRYRRDMKDHHIRVMKGLKLAELENYTLIDWDDVKERKKFKDSLVFINELYDVSKNFKKDVDGVVDEAMGSYMKHTGRTECDKAESRKFLLKELAFFLAFSVEYNHDKRWDILYCCPFKIVGRLSRGEYGDFTYDKIGVMNFNDVKGKDSGCCSSSDKNNLVSSNSGENSV